VSPTSDTRGRIHVQPPHAGASDSSSSTPRVSVTTLGCRVNAFESELIGETFRRGRWEVVDEGTPSEVVVINTCTVTVEADRQARQAVRRAVRRNPHALVVVTGCYAQTDPEACATIPGVDLVLGNDRKLDLYGLLPALERGELPRVVVGDVDSQVTLPAGLVQRFEGQTRAYVQVQQGCDQGCTFCIIHTARGRSRSLPPTLVKRQVERLVLSGHREVVVCGVDVGAYGRDLDGGSGRRWGLAQLLRELDGIDGDFRLRLSSIDPAHIDADLVEAFASSPRLCPHVHLSLQSGNTLILKRMKRRYDAREVRRRVGALRAAVPELVVGADLMVGFPTESEAAFEDTVHMARELRITHPHIFAYSARPGTPAARIPRQVPHPVRRERARRLREVTRSLHRELLEERIGRAARVLVEGGAERPQGLCRARAADYLSVLAPAGAAGAGEWLDVVYEAVRGESLIARPTPRR
jgi:threonylcarbamoyladenosine tRNA methylthiotransferase MtaB